jgi:hypothetical protein
MTERIGGTGTVAVGIISVSDGLTQFVGVTEEAILVVEGIALLLPQTVGERGEEFARLTGAIVAQLKRLVVVATVVLSNNLTLVIISITEQLNTVGSDAREELPVGVVGIRGGLTGGIRGAEEI